MIKSTSNHPLELELQNKINSKTKPQGALGKLETIALRLGKIQHTLTPEITQPTVVVFAGDHGIAEEGEVNPFPQEVTSQMVYNFLSGGAAINVFSKTNAIALKIVDAGVKHDFTFHSNLWDQKVAMGTKNYRYEKAMTKKECSIAMERGAIIVQKVFDNGCNTIGFGEMGIGNTSAAALLMSYVTKIPIEDCVGAGTGLHSEGILRKKEILKEVFAKHAPASALEALQCFGGFEIAMMCGAMLKAAALQMVLLIDGFIVNAALLVAKELHVEVLDYCFFSHCSNEQGHRKVLEYLNVKPILELDLRLGEGTGAALAVPIVKASCDFLNHMASFESAKVSDKT
ncbi:nicotinate-nucleotide--dimethylbenzimidazole phosphoribosyltransferase [Tenacibaculum sp. SG-28]|uniref:nicotinate-nucleotide--dimethylbenzimidazole phosphoribosyltransferase n=1 Tax=Tenacibaculum sp. SG-28 TaxID=754426 RepID=UPI000CF44678|nr:nicotinate-nucleotide--dimethylbenzimidazole phosphoribosyltransferase [Tenacibaculum sp. SG-28]PQJ22784.1 nicotinate-nucleotide--dimethylbenzimidazole phosphoribosyltransferase [Tenacibaculum sp. SG-28]